MEVVQVRVDDAELSSPEVFSRAVSMQNAGQFTEAESLLAHAIARDPANADLRNARGVMFAAMGRHLDALWCYRDAAALNPDDPTIWTNLGNTLVHLKHVQSAAACHRKALALADKDESLLYHNLGTSLAEASQHDEAVIALSRALEIEPSRHTARWDRARSYLFLGNYKRGFSDYEVRVLTGLPPKALPGKPWEGQPYEGKRLLVAAEQGFGDTIWAARYLSRAKALGGELIVECARELIPLLRCLNVADRFIVRGDSLPEADYHCYVCSLPGLFTQDARSIPGRPFLTAPTVRVRQLEELLQVRPSHLKVGIVWSGSVTFKRNAERAQPLLKFFQAFALPGVQLFSLQKGPPEKELNELPRGGPIVDLSPHIHDFADTAAAIAHLDLVIMTDSAVAHLAGSMGKPVWVLLGNIAHWLWLLDRSDSPWYPSARLFRPRGEGDWDYVFDTASAALMSQVTKYRK
jgi:Tfp pilus assembly protein PilF